MRGALLYIKTQLLPNNKDEWVVTLFTDDDVKVQASIERGYKEALSKSIKLSKDNEDCRYTIGNVDYNGNKV